MRTMFIALLCLVLLSFVSCDQDGGSDLNPTQEKIKLLLDELRLADDEVRTAYQANNSYPDGFNRTEEGTTITRTYTAYENAHHTIITGTDTFVGNPPPSMLDNTGSMNMTFKDGAVGTETTFILKMTFPKQGPPVCTECKLDGSTVTNDAAEMEFSEPSNP